MNDLDHNMSDSNDDTEEKIPAGMHVEDADGNPVESDIDPNKKDEDEDDDWDDDDDDDDADDADDEKDDTEEEEEL